MKKKMIQSVLTLAIIGTFMTTAYAGSTVHTSTLFFQGEHMGETRYYEGNNISIDMYNYTTGNQDDSLHPTVFFVSLYKKNFMGKTFIGDNEFDRNGHNFAEWSTEGSGNYYFYYTKARDKVHVKSDKVVMSGY